MSVHSNHLAKPLQGRLSKELRADSQLDLQEALEKFLQVRQRDLYRQLLRDDQLTTVSPDSPESLAAVLGRLKEVEELTRELETLTKGLRNVRTTRNPYA